MGEREEKKIDKKLHENTSSTLIMLLTQEISREHSTLNGRKITHIHYCPVFVSVIVPHLTFTHLHPYTGVGAFGSNHPQVGYVSSCFIGFFGSFTCSITFNAGQTFK